MKTIKTIYLALIFTSFFIAFSLMGCKKENYTSTNELSSSQLKYTDPTPMRFLFKTPVYGGVPPTIIGWEILDCTAPPSNCLPTVVITNSQTKSTSNIEVSYNHFIDKFSKNKVDEFFISGDFMALFPQLVDLPDVLNDLKKSKIKLYHQKSKKDGFDYYVGLPKEIKFSSDWNGLEKCVLVINNKKQ